MTAKRRLSASSASPQRENWSLRYIELQDLYDGRVNQALKHALESSDDVLRQLEGKTGIGAKVQRTQAMGTRSALLQAINQLYAALGKIIREGHKDSAEAAERAFLSDEENLLKILFEDAHDREEFLASQIQKSRRNIQSVMTRVLETEMPLSNRVYQSRALARGLVSRTVNNHLARGSSAADLAKDVRDLIKPTTPGGISYAAKRLARTEMNNAFHAQSIHDMEDRPWCEQVRWHLSKSHPPSQPECRCDYYAHVGLFPADQVPRKPHPNCLCYVTPELMDEKTFLNLLVAGEFREWMGKSSQ